MSKQPKTLSKLATLLEEGQPIAGITGYVAMGARKQSRYNSNDIGLQVFVKVKVLRISTEGGCGMKVIVQPCSGVGEFDITPCQFFDSAKAVESKKDEDLRHEQAEKEEAELRKPHYLHARRTALYQYVEKRLTTPQKESFLAGLNEECGVADIQSGKVTDSIFKKFSKIATLVANGFENEPNLDDDEFYDD